MEEINAAIAVTTRRKATEIRAWNETNNVIKELESTFFCNKIFNSVKHRMLKD